MKKIKKYFYGILLAVIMLSIPKSLVSAASKDQVQNAIQELVNVYPNSCSYFTSDGKIDSNNADSRCALENIPSRGGLPSGSTVQNAYGSKCWSCHAFAEYAWYVIFGHCTNTQTKTISKSELQVGDFIRFSGHSAIYLGENDQYYYVLDSNWASPADNKVRYNHTISKSRGIEACYHATNYDEVTEISNSPVGAVDKIEGNQGSISVYGWAYDLDDVNASLEIHVYIGGEAGSGAECHVINAAEASPDLSPVVGNHRFASTIETSLEGSQPVYIYAINIGSGENVLIGSGNAVITQKNITFEPSTTENVTSSNATITAWGRNKGTMQELGFYFGMDGEYQNQSRIIVSKDVSWTDFCMKYDVNTYYGVLNPGQKYRYAFFCVKDGQEYKSDEAVFTTAGSAGISFDSLNAADVTSESATIHCWGSNSNGYTLSSIGFEIGTGYASEDRKAYEVWKEQSWIRPELTVNISEYCGKLKPDTDYAVRFYANIGQTRYYSDYITFKTESDVITFDEVNISDVSNTNAVLSVWLNNSGTINEIGLYIGDCEQIQERITYTTKDVAWTRANIVIDLNKYWKTLQPGQTYTYVFYAKKGEQEYRSKPGQFTTSGEKRISFEDINISEISMDGAKIGAWFSNSQGNTLTAIGMDIRDAKYGEYTSFEVAHNVGWTRAYLEYNITDYCQILKPKTTYQLRYYIEMDGEKYYSAFSKFTTAEADPSIIQQGICGTNLRWTLNQEGVLKISGKGEMKNYTYRSEMPWYSYKNQIEKVKIESGVTSIGDYAFYAISASSIEIPNTVTAIGDYAFKSAAALKEVVLPNKLTKLGESAFYGCTGLESIDIPASLYTVKPYTFKNCTALSSVTFHEGNLMKLSDGAFYGTALTEVTFPACLNIIDSYCFKNCDKLASIIIPEGKLTEIREAVFYGTAASELTIPEGIKKVGAYAFKNCINLTTINLPDSLTSVGEASFYACTGLQNITISDHVTSIGNYAFRKCTGLTEAIFGNELTEIGESAFYGCSGLKNLNLNNVTTLGGYAFKSCTGLTSVDLGKVETIGESAFHSCTGLENITFPASVASIGDYCFSGSTKLSQMQFEGDAPKIGINAFRGLTVKAVYPADNASWTSEVMQNYGGSITWTALETETSDADTEETVSEAPIEDTDIEKDNTDTENPAAEAPDAEPTEGTCGEGLSWKQNGNELTISGNGKLDNCIWENGSEIQKVIIEENVTFIGDHAFDGLDALTEIIFKGNAPVISINAFAARDLTVKYPCGVTSWTSDIFQNYGGNVIWCEVDENGSLVEQQDDGEPVSEKAVSEQSIFEENVTEETISESVEATE